MSEHNGGRRGRAPDSTFRVSLFVGACLLGFFYGSHFVTILMTPSVKAVGEDSRQRFLSTFREAEVPFMKPGFQQKAGMVPDLYWRNDKADDRKRFFETWLFQYIHHNFITSPPIPFPTCQVYINHDYKFIWIKGHKVGSTALREPLGWLCDDHWKIPDNATFDRCSHALWRQSISLEEARKYWKDYFVFGTVRNPYERFASAFAYVKSGLMSGNCQHEVEKMSFGNVCADPYIYAVLCALGQCWCAGHHFRHFMPQAPCLLTESLQPAVDYLADVSTLREDLETILQTINDRKSEDLPALELDREHFSVVNAYNGSSRQLHEGHATASSGYIHDLYEAYPECLENVAHYFHQDFFFFGYDKSNPHNRSLN